jgi:DNA repair exonuclease SbcCD nuclease subunit
MIKRVYQIADVHIPTYQKLDMYGEQLDKLTNMIREDLSNDNIESNEARIVICGDLVHSKNIVTNELSVFCSTFIRQLSNICKVICIAGNHDLIESNTSRTDTLTAIFQTAQFDNAVFLDMELDYECGTVIDDNITWALYSIYDDLNKPDIETVREKYPNNTVIGLYHGSIVGGKLFNGFISDTGSDPTAFNECDYLFAGHIHKRQELKAGDCKIVYAGSPIQQNYGESLTQHGYVVWDIENKTHEYVDIPSDYGYYDFTITSIDDIRENKEVLINY